MPRGVSKLVLVLLAITTLAVLAWTLGATPAPSATSAGRDEGRTGTLRVMTANVRIATPDDKENAWPLRRELLVRKLLATNPDVIGTQELSPAQGAYLNKELAALYAWYPRAGVGAAPATGASAQLLGVLGDTVATMTTTYYRVDRFEALDGECGLILPSEVQANPSENAYFSLMVLKEKGTGKLLIVVDTHLRHTAPFATRCAQALVEKAAAWQKKHPGAAVLVMGDLNHDRTSPVYAALVGNAGLPLTDSFDYASRKPGELWGTYHGFKGQSLREFPTDLILSQGLRLKTAASIDRTGREGRFPTDHFLVFAEFQP